MNPKLHGLLNRIQNGEKFFRSEYDGDDANIAFKSEVNRLRELQELGYIRLSEKGFVKNHRDGKGYYDLVGPCEITYKGEQILEAASETTSLSVTAPTEMLQSASENTTPNAPTVIGKPQTPQQAFQVWKRRLDDLSDNIDKDLDLKKRYEDALRFENDPKLCAKYENEIQKLNASALSHQSDYEALEKQLSGGSFSRPPNATAEMNDVDKKLDALLVGQENIHQHINALGRALLDRYDAGEQKILGGIIEKISEAQSQTVAEILEASENDRVSDEEMNLAIEAVRQSLATIEAQGKTVIPEQKKLVEAVNAPQFNVKHKLKMTVPIVPYLLNYETELELGSGLNLEGVWNNLKNKFSKK